MYSMASRPAAFRSAAQGYYCRGGSSRSATTAAAAGDGKQGKLRGEYVPVYVVLGLIVMSATLGLRTAGHQLAHAPNVRVDRKKRAQPVPEVAASDLALDEAQRFVGRSLFRKVARVRDDDDDRRLAAEYPGRKAAVTLKDVGVDAPGIPQGKEGLLDRVFKKNRA